MNLYDFSLLILSGISLLIAIILYSRVAVKLCNLFLAICISIGFLYILRSIFQVNSTYMRYEVLLFFPLYLSAGFGPSMFLYFKYIVDDQEDLDLWDLIHFIPLLIQVVFHLYWCVKPFPEKLAFYQNQYMVRIYYYEQLVTIPPTIFYLLIAFLGLIKYLKSYRNGLNRESLQILLWAKNLLILFILLTLLWTFYITMSYLSPGLRLPPAALYPYFFVVTFLILWMTYMIFKYPAITLEHLIFIRSSQKDEEFEERLSRLAIPRMFDLEYGPYPIEELASLLLVDVTYLSSYLRIHFDANYPSWIRDHRMQRFRWLVLESIHTNTKVKINELQRQCGYTNRASFNRDVSKTFDHSPTEYLLKLYENRLHQNNGVDKGNDPTKLTW